MKCEVKRISLLDASAFAESTASDVGYERRGTVTTDTTDKREHRLNGLMWIFWLFVFFLLLMIRPDIISSAEAGRTTLSREEELHGTTFSNC